MARKSQVATISEFLDGSAFIPGPTMGLAAYHAARAIRDSNRMRDPWAALSKVKSALRQFRVSADYVNGTLVLHRPDTGDRLAV